LTSPPEPIPSSRRKHRQRFPTAFETAPTRLRKAVADLTLDKQILAEAARGNF
jgi:hypothetical protein